MILKNLKPGQSFALIGELENHPNDGGLRIFKKVVMACGTPTPPPGQVFAASENLIWVLSEEEQVTRCHV